MNSIDNVKKIQCKLNTKKIFNLKNVPKLPNFLNFFGSKWSINAIFSTNTHNLHEENLKKLECSKCVCNHYLLL